MKATPQVAEPSNGQHKPGTFAALLEQAQAIQNMLRDALLRTNQLLGGLKQYRRQAKVDEQHAGFAPAASGSRGVTISHPATFARVVHISWTALTGGPSEIH